MFSSSSVRRSVGITPFGGAKTPSMNILSPISYLQGMTLTPALKVVGAEVTLAAVGARGSGFLQ
jgi:hypothetical protein